MATTPHPSATPVIASEKAAPPKPLSPVALARALHRFADAMDARYGTHALETVVREFVAFADGSVPHPDGDHGRPSLRRTP